jgi:hypothetical protein
MSKKQTTLESFLDDFSADSEGSGLRPEWKPERDEVHDCQLVDANKVSNEYGESWMLTVVHGGDEMVWFLKGNENRDFDAFDMSQLPIDIQFARTQKQSSKNADRQVNRLFIRPAEDE